MQRGHGPELADWHSGCGSLYSALRRLLQDGLATVAVDLRVGKPPKKVYSITEADRRALQDWIDLPASPGSLRDFVTRLILENNLSRSVLIAHHGQRRSEVADHRIDLEGVVATLGETDHSGQRLALEYALAVAHAEMA